MNTYYLHWHNVRYEASKKAERALMALVWKLPKPVVMWAAIRVGAHATTGVYANQIVPELTFLDALDRWNTEAA